MEAGTTSEITTSQSAGSRPRAFTMLPRQPALPHQSITLTGLTLYPLKGALGVPVDSVELDERGPVGDRRWMLIDASDRFLSLREVARLCFVRAEARPGGLRLTAPGMDPVDVDAPEPGRGGAVTARVWSGPCEVLEADGTASAQLSAFLGIACRLVYQSPDAAGPDAARYGPFGGQPRRIALTDGAPLLLASESSLADLNARLSEPVPMYRFRPNVVVSGAPPWVEDAWRGFTIGSVPFQAVKPCPRCVATTIDYATATRTREPLRTLATFRREGNDLNFGMNVAHRSRGVIRVGDELRLTD